MDEISKAITEGVKACELPVGQARELEVAAHVIASLFADLNTRNAIRDFCDVRDAEDKAKRAAAVAVAQDDAAGDS